MSRNTWRIIKNHDEYQECMHRLLELAGFELAEGSGELEELELLVLLIGHYEDKNFPMDKPSAIEAIKFRMDQSGLKQKDMDAYFGSPSKTSEVLAGKRNLTLSMIRKLHKGMGIPLDVLIQDIDAIDNSETTTGDVKPGLIPGWLVNSKHISLAEPVPAPKAKNFSRASERRVYDLVPTH